jgi:hypothetical protein
MRIDAVTFEVSSSWNFMPPAVKKRGDGCNECSWQKGSREEGYCMTPLACITGDRRTWVSARAAVRWPRPCHWLREVHARRSK